MIKANETIKLALRNVNPATLETLRSKLTDPAKVSEVGVPLLNYSRFNLSDGRLFVRAMFGRHVYATEIETDAAIAVVMNLARVVGYSQGRGRMRMDIQAGGR